MRRAPPPPQSQVIINELQAHGADENYLQSVRRQRNGEPVSSCEIATTLAPKIDFSAEPYQSTKQDCKSLLLSCANQGYGMDTCIKALPACPSANNEHQCCIGSFKNEYLAYRCAGLSVYETLSLIEK